MKFLSPLFNLLFIISLVACGSHRTDISAHRIDALFKKTPLIDGHNDLLIHFVGEDGQTYNAPKSYDIATLTKGQVDLPRLQTGKVSAAIFTIAILNQDDREKGIKDAVNLFHSIAALHAQSLEIVTSSTALNRAFDNGRIAVMLGLEGGDQIGESLDLLNSLHRHGVRSMTLVWEKTNAIGDSNADEVKHNGLSEFGVKVVKRMNDLGMLIDVSHAAESTALDVLSNSRSPVIFSHSSAQALCASPRNVSDELLRKVKKNNGVVMVSLVPYFTTQEYWFWYQRGEAHWAELKKIHGENNTALMEAMTVWDEKNPQPVTTVSDVADHIEHVRRIAGINHVGIGSDFDGMGSFAIKGLEDTATFPALFLELARRGWNDEELGKLAGGNFLRVMRDVEVNALTH